MFLSRWEQRLYEIRFVWIQKDVGEKRAQFVPICMPTVCWKTFPAKTTKVLSTRNSKILSTIKIAQSDFIAAGAFVYQKHVIPNLRILIKMYIIVILCFGIRTISALHMCNKSYPMIGYGKLLKSKIRTCASSPLQDGTRFLQKWVAP